jgi:hypothetical protein
MHPVKKKTGKTNNARKRNFNYNPLNNKYEIWILSAYMLISRTFIINVFHPSAGLAEEG